LSDPRYCLRTYAVEIRAGAVWLKLPPLAIDEDVPTTTTEEPTCARP
jgi:hypothetical protein